jgi:prepilin-type N-terminal cleavage/methylation domain-containing protein
MNRLSNQKGFTLVEILVASAILIFAIMAIQTVILHVTTEGVRVNQRSRLEKVARAVIYELTENARKYPAAARDARFDDPNFQAFDDNSIADQSCYTEEGGSTSTSSPDCLFRVSSYKIQMANSTFAAGSDLRPMPLYRLFIRFTYPENGKTKQFIVTQFLTPTLWQ